MNQRLFLLILVFITTCCSYEPKDSIYYKLINNSDSPALFFLPHKMMQHWPGFIEKGMNYIDKNDTTLKTAGYVFFHTTIDTNESYVVNSNYSTISDFSDCGVVRIFVCKDVDSMYSLNQMIDSDDYLIRYDFSLSDLELLMNEKREIIICYPPDSTMKDVKMWPPYETFAK